MDIVASEPLHLNNEELEILVELLDREQAELRLETRHTDTRAFRDGLKHRLAVIEGLLGRLRKN